MTLEALVERIDERTEWLVCEMKKSRAHDDLMNVRLSALENFKSKMVGVAAAASTIAGVLGALAALLLTSCSVGQPDYVKWMPSLDQVTVRVVSDNWLQAKVYAIYGNGRPERLVTVTTRGEAKLNANRMSSGFRFQVRLLADRSSVWVSENLFWARGGDCIELRINSLLSTSYVTTC